MDTNYSLADIAAATGGNRDNDGFGDGNGWWIILFFLWIFARGGDLGSNGGSAATQAEIQRGFDNQAVVSKLDGITQGICDSTYALNNAITNGFNNTNMGMMQGFNGVERGFCNLSSQLSNCCCENREAIAQVRYDMAAQACDTRNAIQTSTRDLLENQNSNTRAILDYLCQDKIASLQAENQSLKLAASQQAQNAFITANQEAQTAELIRRLGRDCPIPAFVVPNPNGCYGTPVGVLNNGCGYNSGCGC